MLIFSQITPLFTIMLLTSLIFPQFEEVNVIIDTRQVRENDRLIFESLGDDVSEKTDSLFAEINGDCFDFVCSTL